MLYIAGRQAEKHFLLDQKMYLQTIHLPPAVYSRQPLLSTRWKIPLLNSLRKPHLRSPQTQSLHCLRSGWTRVAGGRWSPQFSQEKGRARAELFPKKRLTMNTLHSLENRARVLSAQRKLHLRSPRTHSLHCLSSGWTRAAGGRWLPQFSQEKGTSKSGAFSICDRRKLSLFTASAAAGPEPRVADDCPNSLKKRDEQERSFSQRKGSQWTHSIPSRTERACSPPNA